MLRCLSPFLEGFDNVVKELPCRCFFANATQYVSPFADDHWLPQICVTCDVLDNVHGALVADQPG